FSIPTTSHPRPAWQEATSLVSPERYDPLLPHHGLSTKHVDTETRLSAAGYSPDDARCLSRN
ncbi:MAG: hypothetical protein ACK4Y9_13600, partial [Hyphomonas sp.]